MNQNFRNFSIKKIVSTDYASMVFVGMIVVSWLIVAYTEYTGYTINRSFFSVSYVELIPSVASTQSNIEFAVSSSITCAILFLWRFSFFRKMHKNGVEVTGYIDESDPTGRNRSRIEYNYEYEGIKYLRGNAVSSLNLMDLKLGDDNEVTLLVNPNKPKQAIIRDLYFKKE